MADLRMESFSSDAGTAIRLAGRLDGDAAPELDRYLNEHITDPALLVILDFENLSFISSAGLRTLLILAKRIDAGGGTITIVNLQPTVDEVFAISGFKSLFKQAPGLAAALADSGMPKDLCGAPAAGEPTSAETSGLGRMLSRIMPKSAGR